MKNLTHKIINSYLLLLFKFEIVSEYRVCPKLSELYLRDKFKILIKPTLI